MKTILCSAVMLLIYCVGFSQVKRNTQVNNSITVKELTLIFESVKLDDYDNYFYKLGYVFISTDTTTKRSGEIAHYFNYKNKVGNQITFTIINGNIDVLNYSFASFAKFVMLSDEAKRLGYKFVGMENEHLTSYSYYENANLQLGFQKTVDLGKALYSISVRIKP